MPDIYRARCFDCDWGLTGELDNISDSIQEHVEQCPGPVIALKPQQSVTTGAGELRFWSAKTRCGGCGMPHSLCLCQRVE